MLKINKRIEIVRSSKLGMSSMGRKSSDRIQAVLESHYRHVSVSIVNTVDDLAMVVQKQPDVAFVGLKSVPPSSYNSNKVWVTEYLDRHNVCYTGSNAQAMALEFNKTMAKDAVLAAGLDTSAYFMAFDGEFNSVGGLPLAYPLFIKPLSSGGGNGIDAQSVVHDFISFESKVRSLSLKYSSSSLVEQYLSGREFSVAILDSGKSAGLLIMPVELIVDEDIYGNRVLGRDVKDMDNEKIIAIADPDLKLTVATAARNAFYAIGAKGYGRIDIRLDGAGTPHFIEANLIPGLDGGYFQRACWINQGMSYEAMILLIVEYSLHDISKSSITHTRGMTALS